MKITSQKSIPTLPVGKHSIAPNLRLKVRAGNFNPAWIFYYTFNKKAKEIWIGCYPDISMALAKEIASSYRAVLKQGIDPKDRIKELEEAERAKQAALEAQKFTVSDLIKEAVPVILETKQGRNAKHKEQWINTLNTYVVPVIGSMKVEDVTRDNIIDVLKPIWFTKSETASRVRGRLESVFNYAIVKNHRTASNPCTWRGNLDFFLPPPSKIKNVKHHVALPFDETRTLIDKWMKKDKLSVSAICVMFGILTAARVGEFLFAKWGEIDFDNAVWTCPPERRKDGKKYPHRVPLSRQAIVLLTMLLNGEPREDMPIFAINGRRICRDTPRVVIRKAMNGRGTMHGFRSTFRDWCAENGKDRILAEKALMHATGNEVEQAYQRSDLLEQRRVLMQEWADALFGEIKPS